MLVPEFQYLVPETLAEACALLGQYGEKAKVLAGGSDLIVKMKFGLLKPSYLLSLKKLGELKGVRQEPGVGVIIGARTTHNELVASPVLSFLYPSVNAAAASMAGYQIRNVGTIGGNLVNAVPSADLPPILLALDTQVRLVSAAGERRLPLEKFFVGPGKTVLEAGEILAELLIPEQTTTGSNYIKFGLRKAEALAVVGVASAVTMAEGTIKEARIALGAVAPVPMRARIAEDALRGQRPTPELLEKAGELAAGAAQPITDIRGSAEYRRHLVAVLTRESLQAAIEKGHS
ncbi:MAG: xanthine dehydrogenase family protein subunit M [Candidatus Korobacteraceae bacterium]|jgi:carbon-monoxide dehydrogenase medium subunit